MRTTRGATPVLYGADEEFPIGGSRVLRSSDGDDVTIVGAGITLHEALEGGRDARRRGHLGARDRPLLGQADRRRRRCDAAAEATGGDRGRRGPLARGRHRRRGARGARRRRRERAGHAWLAPCASMPGSGKPAELLDAAGIDAEHIAEARALARRLDRQRLEQALVQLALPLAGGRVDLGPPRVGLVGLAERRGSGSMPSRSSAWTAAPRAEPSGTPEAVTGRAEHVGEHLDPPLVREQRVPGGDDLSHLGQRARRSRRCGRRRPRARPAAGRARRRRR